MHVPLTRRTQILLDDERHDLLRRRAADTGRSVADLIREAIDRTYASEGQRESARARRREQALASFLAAPPLPVDDWPVMEREIEEGYERSGEET